MAQEKEKIVYSDPMAIIQVLGALASNPLLLGDDRYRFSVNDFPEDFHRYVFKAIVGIALQSDDGEIDIERIEPIDVDHWLKNYPEWYLVFTSNDGAKWLRKAIDGYDPGKFHYHYNVLKKYSLLNAMRRDGIDTTPFLDPSLVDPVEMQKKQAAFDAMSVKDILSAVEVNLIDLKEKYDSSDTKVEAEGGESIFETLAALKESPEIGAGFISQFLTTALRGMRLGTLVVESAPQGVGKSRRQAGEVAKVAISEAYNAETGEWEKYGYGMPALLISSELTLKEVQYMWLSFVSAVPEERIVLNEMNPEEEKRVMHAAKVIESSPLFFVEISNYDVGDIENIIKKYVLTKGVAYVFFDYVGTTQKILSSSARSTKMSGLREDQILLMFMERLKNLAKILNIFIYTATQISGNWKEIKEADQQMIRGAKAIADKPDGGWVLLPVREADRMIIDQYLEKGFVDEPTHVLHIYKNRGNPLVNIRIYGRFIRNTCRWYDCFVTDFQGHMKEITPINVVWDADGKSDSGEAEGKISETPQKRGKKSKSAKAASIDVGELPDVVEDELPSFDYDPDKNADVGWGWNAQADNEYVDASTVVGPFSEDDPSQVAQPAEEEKPSESKPAWGAAFGGLDF